MRDRVLTPSSLFSPTAWVKALEWPHKAEFNQNASQTEWSVDGTAAGTLRTSNGLSFLRVYDAGN